MSISEKVFSDPSFYAHEPYDDEPPVKEYPQREIFRRSGRYTQCQVLNWDDGPPPKFLACHPLDGTHTGFIAAQRMGTWAEIDIHEVERRLNGTWPTAL